MQSHEVMMKNANEEVAALKRELDLVRKEKKDSLAENRRLQGELAGSVNDNRKQEREIEITHREIEDLKRQLKEYVHEVKRAEDLLEKKVGLVLVWVRAPTLSFYKIKTFFIFCKRDIFKKN